MSNSGIPENAANAADSNVDTNPVNDNAEKPSKKKPSLLKKALKSAEERKMEVVGSPSDWLELCETEPMAYANFADRLLKAIGEPEKIDTKKLSEEDRAYYQEQEILRYPAFADIYDQEEVLTQIVTHIKKGGNGMAFIGAVGTGKTDVATILERAIEKEAIYVLRDKRTGEVSPDNDSPMCLISEGEGMSKDLMQEISEAHNIPLRLMNVSRSSWVTKRLEVAEGDFDAAFDVVKIYPSRNKKIAVAKLESGDKQSPDLNAIIGEVDHNKIGAEDPTDETGEKTLSSGDPDAYVRGAFSHANQGIFHWSEFLRSHHTMTNKLLDPVVDGVAETPIGKIPYNALTVVTSNMPVWNEFMARDDSDAFSDRFKQFVFKYTLRMSAEKKIYESKFLPKDGLDKHPLAPNTLDLLAEFAVRTRMTDGVNDSLKAFDRHIRALIHDGRKVEGADKKVPTLHLLREKATPDEGTSGLSLRTARDLLRTSFNARAQQGYMEADTFMMIETIRDYIKNADDKAIPADKRELYNSTINDLEARNLKNIREIIRKTLLDADDGICQAQFNRYIEYARALVEDRTLTEFGEKISKDAIERHLTSVEKKGNQMHPVEFRKSVVQGYLREVERNVREGKENPLVVNWKSIGELKKVIEAQHDVDIDARIKIVVASSANMLSTEEEKRQYKRFHESMHEQGYTDTMTHRMVKEL